MDIKMMHSWQDTTVWLTDCRGGSVDAEKCYQDRQERFRIQSLLHTDGHTVGVRCDQFRSLKSRTISKQIFKYHNVY